jgi:branched-chain amino acid transport system permease protein
LLAFFIGCFLAGIAGSLMAHTTYTLSGEQFSFNDSILYVGMIIIGGLGTTLGPILGVTVIYLLQKVLLPVYLVPYLEKTFTNFPAGFASGVPSLVFGIILVLFLILEPRGLAHRWALFKAAYRLWPFSY